MASRCCDRISNRVTLILRAENLTCGASKPLQIDNTNRRVNYSRGPSFRFCRPFNPPYRCLCEVFYAEPVGTLAQAESARHCRPLKDGSAVRDPLIRAAQFVLRFVCPTDPPPL